MFDRHLAFRLFVVVGWWSVYGLQQVAKQHSKVVWALFPLFHVIVRLRGVVSNNG